MVSHLVTLAALDSRSLPPVVATDHSLDSLERLLSMKGVMKRLWAVYQRFKVSLWCKVVTPWMVSPASFAGDSAESKLQLFVQHGLYSCCTAPHPNSKAHHHHCPAPVHLASMAATAGSIASPSFTTLLHAGCVLKSIWALLKACECASRYRCVCRLQLLHTIRCTLRLPIG